MFLDDERIDFSLSDRAQRELWVPSLVEIINIVCREAIALGFSSAALLEYCKEILVIKLLREPLKEESVPGGPLSSGDGQVTVVIRRGTPVREVA